MSTEKIAIIGGTGDLGFGLAVRWAKAGLPVTIGSRDADKAEEAAQRAREQIQKGAIAAAENAKAAAGASIVVLAVPFAAQAAILKSIRPSLKDCVLVDCTVPLAVAVGGRVTRLLGVWEGSAAQAAREVAPKEIPVVAAFHNVSASVLSDLDAKPDCDVLVCGDDASAKERVSALIGAIAGLRAVDAGPLEMARVVEGVTALLIGLNRRAKGAHTGIRITGL
jgi:NADPH-dependent F420 reductase